MRAMTFGTLFSSLLWAAIVWCFLALRVAAGHNHFHLSTDDFGISLLGIDLAYFVTFMWIDRQMRASS